MADSDFIDKVFSQNENMCVMGSYSIIINYFSDEDISINDVLTKYKTNYNLTYLSTRSNGVKKRNKAIVKHMHDYCQLQNMRGFDFITNMHNNDKINTKDYCSIDLNKAGLTKIQQPEIDIIKKVLSEKDSLGMVLYTVNQTTAHAIIIGYDEEKNQFFQRDSEKKGIVFSDKVFENNITEYIIFTDNKE